jgi:hypothetical protein
MEILFLKKAPYQMRNLNGTWGRFGGAAGVEYLELNYVDNP